MVVLMVCIGGVFMNRFCISREKSLCRGCFKPCRFLIFCRRRESRRRLLCRGIYNLKDKKENALRLIEHSDLI